MKFRFNMPVSLYFGSGVIKDNNEKFRIGNKALIVTGKNSARLSGALDDVTCALEATGTDFEVYDGVVANPSLDNVTEGAEAADKAGADFIVAIGGGSPLDAAKAIAALSTNDINAEDLIGKVPAEKSLPMIAVPTTAGTGSEVTPYSILTVPSLRTKKNFYSPSSFPVFAFADPGYTGSLPYEITVDTAFDAFSHLLESYFSLRSTGFNDTVALEGIGAFAECMGALANGNLDYSIREKLLYASCLGGIAITHTGTTLIHAMGYSLTYFRGYSHGRANAMLIGEYLRLNKDVLPDKTARVLEILGFDNVRDADEYFSLGPAEVPILTDDECREFAGLAAGQGSVRMNPRKVGEDDIYHMYKKVFGGT